MKKRKRNILCPDCKTGKESCAVDPNSSACPYISCYDGRDCSYYSPLEVQDKKECSFKKLIQIKELFKKDK